MSRQQAPAKKATVYRLALDDERSLSDCINPRFIEKEGFQSQDVVIDGNDSILVTGQIATPEPRWVSHLASLTGVNPGLQNANSAVALVVPIERHAYAITWGLGHLLLDSSVVDNGFGLRFAIRKASAERVKSLTSHTLDTLSRTARTSVPSGAALDAFGIEEVGEVISRLVGRIQATGLTAANGKADTYTTIRGADGLSIPLARSATDLVKDLKYLENTVENEPPMSGLEHFEHTRPLRPGDAVIEELQKKLSAALEPGAHGIALTWPAEWQDEHGEADSYRLRGAGAGREEQPEELELGHLITPLSRHDPAVRFEALRRMTIQGLNAEGDAISRAIHGDKWITFQTDHKGKRYVLHQGRWFDIGGAYLELLRGKVSKILGKRSDISLCDWPQEVKPKQQISHATEGNYNILAPISDPRLLRLDKQLLRTKQHPRGFEVCDLLGPNDELIHVKRLDDSVSASHLFNQAIVSAEALRRQADTVTKMREVVTRESGGKRTIPEGFRPRKVILAFGGRRADAKSLFTFSQVTLVRCAQRLAELEVELEIIEINDSPLLLNSDFTLSPRSTQ
ncbi:DUF6119 family protein [Streptomyces nigra]|uniref:DUF6119 family protein n=1 Tax=Streptomyces nigra TaxID=1827580 RepID=UPI0036CA1223